MKKADCPPNVRIIKHYYKPHIEDLKSRFASARELGKGSAEEWVKGLEVEGGERTSRILTWEQWEGKGGLKKVNARPSGKLSTMRTSAGNKSTMQLASSSLQQSVAGESVLHGFAGSFAGTAASPAPQSGITIRSQLFSLPYSHSNSLAVAPTFKPTNQVSHGNGMLPQRPGSQAVPPRQERTLRDVNEAKAVRRAEIERRCAALQPPLTSNLLRHMNSFQAALQISLPLTEKAWEVLAPRLLSQREMAENAEREWAQQVKAIEAEAKESRRSEASQLEPKESIEHEWELSHTPLWDRLSGYADEIIQGQWAAGQAVTKENCSRFAVDVLLHVRKRFYDDLATDKTGTYGTRKQIEDRESHEKSDEKLILEHMKWVFDNKIKAFTEHFQRELFMCSGCEGSSKFYGFEAVIQHYAAKHTTSLSQGSVVVHWRAEWPDPPPFVLNPSLANSVFYAVPTPAVSASPPQPSISQAPQPGHGNTTAAFTVASPVAVPYNGFGSNYLGSYYPQYAAHYPSQQQPGSATGQSHYPHLFGHLSPITNGSYVYQGPQSGYVAQTFPPDRPPIYPMGHQPHAESHASSYGYSPHMPLVALPGAHLYQTQREEMAKQARDVWFATSGIKDLPQSVRIHVVIQHVVSRFEQKYTNEPSLSMFLDGLDSSSLMRPVRSLNGLACKTCVATANATHPTSSPLAPQSLTDRKLYTLPHLLNHFRSAHLERVQPTIDLQTGMKAARLDWTKDMIELPEAHLIARLTTASGMTDTKLRLIATVLPGVFPDPLPDICADKASGPVPKYGPVQPHKSQHQSPRQPGIRHIAGSQEFGGSASHESSLSPAGAHLPSQRRTEALESEPPGDDEYDPHRPAFLGRIVEHHHISHPLSRSGEDASGQRQYCSDSIGSATHTTNSEALRHSTSFSRDNGPYGIQLLRHQDKSHQQVLQVRSTYTAVNQNTEPIHKLQKESRFDVEPEVMAADRFLNELKPEIGDLDNRGLSSNLQATSRCMSQAFSELAETEDTESTREQRYVPSNIYSRAPAITSSDTYMYQRQARPEEFRYSTRRVQYVYADDGRPIENFSQAGTITSKYSLPSRGADGSTYAYIDHIRLSNDNLQPERGLIPSRITTPPAEASNSLGYGRDSLNSPRHKINHAEHLAHASLDNIQSYSHEPRYYESSGTDPRARHTEYIPVSPNDYQYMVRYEPNQEAAGRYPYRSEDNLAQGSIVRDRRVRYSEDLLSGSRYQPNSSANHQTHHVYR